MSNRTLLQNTFGQLVSAIKPEKLIDEQCRLSGNILSVLEASYDLSRYKKIHLLGSGKAVVPMATAVQNLLKGRLAHTLIVGAYPLDMTLDNSDYIQSSHPLPSPQSIQAAAALQEAMRAMDREDLFIYLLSGGNSALVELPEEGISLAEFQDATSLMLHGGMPIDAINCVRKHLSKVKGGKLAELTEAQGIVLVLSDVIGDDLHAIGSAPLYCDTTTFGDAVAQLKRYALFEKMPHSVQSYLTEGEQGRRSETPKTPQKHIDHHILGSNMMVLQKAATLLHEAGIETKIIAEPLQGDVAAVAQKLLELAREPVTKSRCYLLGGEATVVVKGEGKGGRNQHLCLSLLTLLEGDTDITFLSAATDGVDGNSQAAGALIDLHSRANAQVNHLDLKHYLETFDSNTFFAKSGELLIPGPTHNNLLDIVMMLIEPKPTQGENNG
jgi:glycerate 2-kinase